MLFGIKCPGHGILALGDGNELTLKRDSMGILTFDDRAAAEKELATIRETYDTVIVQERPDDDADDDAYDHWVGELTQEEIDGLVVFEI